MPALADTKRSYPAPASTGMYLLALAMALSCLAVPAAAGCLSETEVARLFADYQARHPAATPQGLSIADGECSRDRLNELFRRELGEPVGYKAGLTNPAVQARFHHDAPVRGSLYQPMLLPGGSAVPARFGTHPRYEADLLVRVSSAAINRASSPLEVMQAIDQVIPFIELPDLVVAEPAALDGAGITAINVGARLGVMGSPMTVTAAGDLVDALGRMQVAVRGNGLELDQGRGSDVLGHPLNAVIWIAADLARSGLALKPGDLVSVGSFSRLLTPEPGLRVTVQYLGLPGSPAVSVNFE